MSQKLFDVLYPKNVHLITNVKKNMKNIVCLI
ncbi:hypothetical protein [Clostridium thailandense]